MLLMSPKEVILNVGVQTLTLKNTSYCYTLVSLTNGYQVLTYAPYSKGR